jgi:hypothetical protein
MMLKLVVTDGWSTSPNLAVVQHIANTLGRDRFAIYDRIRYLKKARIYNPQPSFRPVS